MSVRRQCRHAPRKIDWRAADASKWKYPEIEYSGSYSFHQNTKPVIDEAVGSISEGIQRLKAEPSVYDGIFFQSNMKTFPNDQQKYSLVKRTGSGFSVKRQGGGPFTWIPATYDALAPNVHVIPDKYTDHMSYEGNALRTTLLPGRGEGCADVPHLAVFADVEPSDVSQGGVGDCWLLSAISALAEFKAAIPTLFKKTRNINNMPGDQANEYTITLWDLPSWKPVDVTVDERLVTKSSGDGLLGCAPSSTGELWCCYLEKAIACHCGGWDQINGGQCTHAWRLLTGCKEQYTFTNHGGVFSCSGSLNPNTGQWEPLANSPHEGFRGLWPMPWPKIGGGGSMDDKLDSRQMFERMCEWHAANYVMACGTRAGSDAHDTEGIVDGHAYTILDCIKQVGGSKFDLIKVRNPWGRGEFKSGMWDDDGPGWQQYPEVKVVCKPVQADDGVFWLDRDEFVKYYSTVYLCAYDMSVFCKDAMTPPNVSFAGSSVSQQDLPSAAQHSEPTKTVRDDPTSSLTHAWQGELRLLTWKSTYQISDTLEWCVKDVKNHMSHQSGVASVDQHVFHPLQTDQLTDDTLLKSLPWNTADCRILRLTVCKFGLKVNPLAADSASIIGLQSENQRLQTKIRDLEIALRQKILTCPHDGCGCRFVQLDLQKHETECGHRILSCPHVGCGKQVKAKDLSIHMFKQCDHRIVPCMRRECKFNNTLKSKDVSEHQRTCPH